MDGDFRIWERVITPNEVQQLYNGVPDGNVTMASEWSLTVQQCRVQHSRGYLTRMEISWQNKLYQIDRCLFFSLVRGHSYDVKAFRDGNGNGSLDPGIGEPYAHWGSWNGNGFDLLPVDGKQTGIDISSLGNPILTTMDFHFAGKQWRVH